MIRQEKIKHIAGLVNVNVLNQDITDYPLTDEELLLKTLKELARFTDSQLDEVIDKVWEITRNIQENTSLPELKLGE